MPVVNGVMRSLLTPRSSLRPGAMSPEFLPPLPSAGLLARLRERIRGLHYSMRTGEVYPHWCKAHIRFHDRRHPTEMDAPEVEASLQHLAAQRGVSQSTHNQALSALLFLCGKVLQVQLPWLNEIGRPPVRRRLSAQKKKGQPRGAALCTSTAVLSGGSHP